MAFFHKSSERERPLATSKDRSRIDWRLALLFVTSLVLCWPTPSTQAQDVSRADVGKWLDTRPSVPNFKADDVLSSGACKTCSSRSWSRPTRAVCVGSSHTRHAGERAGLAFQLAGASASPLQLRSDDR
jgi:hypothetical protein